MKEILSKYKERLINLSGRNRSLVSKTLPKLRAFDLYKVEEFSDGFLDNIIEFISIRETKNFEILPDYNVYYIDRLNKMEKEINNKKKKELSTIKVNEEKELCKIKAQLLEKEEEREQAKEEEKKQIEKEIYNIKEKYNKKLEEENKKISSIKEKYNKNLEEEKERLAKKRDKIIDYSVSLRTLLKEVNSIIKETGRNELYIGYPFVEGTLKDNTFVKAPLFMFPVSLIRDGDKYLIQNKPEAVIYLNKVLLLAICKHNEIKVKNIKTEFNTLENDYIGKALKELKENNIIIEKEDENITRFKEYRKDTMPNFQLGQLKLTFNLILGQFPIANSIYTDYEEMLEMKINNQLLETLLKTGSINQSNSLEKEEEHGKLSFSEKELFLISSLDYSQEKAVKLTNETNKLVIYGPPGTGKSQTIANIISNALAKNKRVLMVSQKKAALDVIYNRLGKLNSKALVIHDTESDKKFFYSNITQSLDEITENKENNQRDLLDLYKEIKNTIFNISNSIDEKIEQLETLAEVLHKERDFGLTLQQMYSKTKSIENREDERYEYYFRFRKENPLKEYKYEELKKAFEGIKEEEISSYKTYKELLKENPFIDDVDLNINFMDIDEFSLGVNNIIEPIKAITDKATNDIETYSMFTDTLKENSYELLNEEKLISLTKDVNQKKNGHLLDPINDKKWWSIKHWMNYSSNKKQEEENRLEFEERQIKLKESIEKLNKEIQDAFNDIAIVKKALNDRVYDLVIEKLLQGEDLTKYFQNIIKTFKLIDQFKEELKTVKDLDDLQTEIMEYALNENEAVMKYLLEFAILINLKDIEKTDEVNDAHKYLDNFYKIVASINNNLKKKQRLVNKLILTQWNNVVEDLQMEKEFKEFKRQANKKKALLPIRKYIEEYSKMILNLFPCFLLSPETASEILPLKEGLFDIVIFDEASQMYIENAIPTIFRGKQVIIAGDDKQLRPNGVFSNRYVEEDEEYDQDSSAALEEESLLDLAKVNYDSVHLNYHYRSSFEELINFSNYAFYEGRLKVSPNVTTLSDYGKPIERIMVDGRWIDRANIEEAEKVVDIVEKILKERQNNETLGIITFNINQKSVIEDMLEKRARDNEEFRQVYIKEIDRVENNEDISLFVKNIENVQGDERDIIIFSIAYGKNQNGRVSLNFGSLSQEGGENRLNVAISRAKKKIYVVTSIEPEELEVENTKNNGPKLFKKYLQYVRAVSNEDKNETENILNSLVDTKFKDRNLIKYDSDFEAEVYDALVEKGYQVHTQVGVSGYRIDLAIYDSAKSKYILGIECDGATYHSSKSARERDVHRQRYLESRGWKIARIWSYNWWSNPKKEIEKICNILSLYNKEAE